MMKSRKDEILEKLRRDLLPSKPERPAPTAQERWDNRQRELEQGRYQAAIDTVWERTLEVRREAEARAGQGCHRGPGDEDWL
jgi:hypothetical protein